jgi:DNA-binding IclR family transcriptional regulator
MRARLGPVPSARLQGVREAQTEKRKILAALAPGEPLTVPEIARVTGIPAVRVMRRIATLRKYGSLRETFLRGDYYAYSVAGLGASSESA